MRNDRSKGDWLSVACVALAISALGCSTDPKSICEQVYPKIKQCVDALDCATISDATAKTKCEEKKQAYGSATYRQSVTACKKTGFGVCDCDDKNKTAAEELWFCTLDPSTCDCATNISVCEQVYSKVKQCVDALDCAAISDATAKTKCEEKKQAYGSATYGESVAACKTAGSGVCDCVDKNKTAAEGYSGCALDPATCDCASAAADMGVSDGSVAD
jgi:hypothetical protein